MHIAEILKQPGPHLSFEFFPPKTPEGSETLFNSIKELMPLKPAYVSVTYGAGGSTRELTHDLIVKLREETDLTIISHLTCVGSSRGEIHSILDRYWKSGIRNIMALRGDPPKGHKDFVQPADGFAHAGDLVRFIKENFPEMGVGVAGFPEGHPGTPNRLREMEFFKEKVDSGADYICTQMFFDNRDYLDYQERCRMAGIEVPIIAGIMPVSTRKGMERMAELALGCRFPAKLQKAVAGARDDDEVARIGIDWAARQVKELIEGGVPGIHFYTLNRSDATKKIYASLGYADSQAIVRSRS